MTWASRGPPQRRDAAGSGFPYVIKARLGFVVEKHSSHLKNYHLIMSAY